MLGLDPKAARATWTAAVIILLLATVYAIRETLVVFAVALLFAYLLYPLFDWIDGRLSTKNRVPALALTYLLVMGILAATGAIIGSQVVAEARQLIDHPPDVQGFLDRLGAAHPALAPVIDAAQGSIRGQFGEMVSAAPRLGLQVVAASASLIDLIIIPLLSFFILKDGRRIRAGFLTLFHGAARVEADNTLAGIHTLLVQYMRTLFILCCTVLAVFSVALAAMGVRYALLLSAIAFFCEFVPLVGPLTAAVVILTVSALTGYPHLVWVAAFLGAFRMAQDYVISPRLMSKGVELHPLLVIFGVFAGARIGGVAGVFLSVPILALGRLLLSRLAQRQPGPGSA